MPGLVFLFRFLLLEMREGSSTPHISFNKTPRPTVFQFKNVLHFEKYYMFVTTLQVQYKYYYSVIHYINLFSLFIYFLGIYSSITHYMTV